MKSDEYLYENQVLTLQILYKFRFGTNKLIASYRGIKRSSVNESLLTLLKNKYISRRYDNKKKINGKPAVYYLTTKGVNYLKTRIVLTDKIVNSVFKNHIVGDDFIEHNLAVFKSYMILQSQYKDNYNVFTMSELAKFDNYPEVLPDLFLGARNKQNKDYMLNLYLNEPFFVIKKRIKYYIEHRNEHWNDKEPYPSVLLVCPNAKNKEKVVKFCESQLEDFDFLITTIKDLDSGQADIWSDAIDPEKHICL